MSGVEGMKLHRSQKERGCGPVFGRGSFISIVLPGDTWTVQVPEWPSLLLVLWGWGLLPAVGLITNPINQVSPRAMGLSPGHS